MALIKYNIIVMVLMNVRVFFSFRSFSCRDNDNRCLTLVYNSVNHSPENNSYRRVMITVEKMEEKKPPEIIIE